MSLIKCPECNKEISNTIDSCPHCGFKLKKISNHYKEDIITIQQTSKKIKLNILMSTLIFIVSSLIGFVSIGNDKNPSFWFFIAIVSLVWLIISSIKRWWYHG